MGRVELYADHLCRQRHKWLQITPGMSYEFVETHLDDVVDIVHILRSSSTGDDGFSVMDYRAVDPRLGSG